MARSTSDPELREALLDYQYPYKVRELLGDSRYSQKTKMQVLALDNLTQPKQ